MTTLKLLGNRIASRILPLEAKKGVIWLCRTRGDKAEGRPGSAAFDPKAAIVIAVGQGVEDPKTGAFAPITGVKIGDQVLLPAWPGVAIPFGVDADDNAVEIEDSRMGGLIVTDVTEILCVCK